MSVKQKEVGVNSFFNVEWEEIARAKLAQGIELVVSLVNDEHLELRLWLERGPYKGLRFHLPEEVFEEIRGLIDRVDKVRQERLENRIHQTGGEAVAEGHPHPQGYVTATI